MSLSNVKSDSVPTCVVSFIQNYHRLILRCFSKYVIWIKPFSQVLQLCGSSPPWLLLCFEHKLLELSPLQHGLLIQGNLHVCDFIPYQTKMVFSQTLQKVPLLTCMGCHMEFQIKALFESSPTYVTNVRLLPGVRSCVNFQPAARLEIFST